MLLSGDTPSAPQRAALDAAAAPYPGARLAVAVVDTAAVRAPGALLRALYGARPAGAGHFAAALVLAPTTVAPPAPAPACLRELVPPPAAPAAGGAGGAGGAAPAELARLAAAALGRGVPVLAPKAWRRGLEGGACYVLPLGGGADAAGQVGAGMQAPC
jgi:hypothetical protein